MSQAADKPKNDNWAEMVDDEDEELQTEEQTKKVEEKKDEPVAEQKPVYPKEKRTKTATGDYVVNTFYVVEKEVVKKVKKVRIFQILRSKVLIL